MRRVLWIFSAPVIAGGLAWAVNAADSQTSPVVGAPQAQNGKIFYFSRGGKSGTAAADSDSDDSSADDAADDAEAPDTPPVAQRYVRKRPATAAPAKPPAKNYYQDLFSDSDAPTTPSPKRSSSTTRPAKPANAASAAGSPSQANRKAIVEDGAVSESTDADLTGEEVQLPPAGKTQQTGGTSRQGRCASRGS